MNQDDKVKQIVLEQQIFDALPLGLLIYDKNNKIYAWNRWLEEKTGLSKEEVTHKSLDELYPEKSFERFNWAIEQVITFSNPQVLSQALNQYLIPITMDETHYKGIQYMQQHIELHPLHIENTVMALIVVTDVTSKFYEKTDLLNLAKKYSTESIHDALTGIYNRRYLWDWLDNAIKSSERKDLRIACCLFDLDYFKEINDTYGHKEGDKYLLIFVKTVNDLIRGSDVFIRYGGDEFVIISIIDKGKIDGLNLPRRVIQGYFEPKSSTVQYQRSCSCGITIWSKEDNPVNSKTLLQQADEALYKAKASGRNCSWLYSPDNKSS